MSGQKFCEKCGASFSAKGASVAQANVATTMPNASAPTMKNSSAAAGSLFDPNRMAYVIKEKFWDWGSGPIYDATGKEIGKMHRKILSIRRRIEFQELNGTIAASIHQKLLSIRQTYDLHDGDNGPLIGRFSKSLFSILRPKFELVDPNGKIIMTAQGKFMGFDIELFRGSSKDPKDKIAEVHKADRWRDVFFSGAWDFSDTYGVKVIDPSIDRKLLMGFVITIDNVLFDKK
jgi:uncharacterized protein YxjI